MIQPAEVQEHIRQALTWLQTHPNTHSAKRGDVRLLAADSSALLDALKESEDANSELGDEILFLRRQLFRANKLANDLAPKKKKKGKKS